MNNYHVMPATTKDDGTLFGEGPLVVSYIEFTKQGAVILSKHSAL